MKRIHEEYGGRAIGAVAGLVGGLALVLSSAIVVGSALDPNGPAVLRPADAFLKRTVSADAEIVMLTAIAGAVGMATLSGLAGFGIGSRRDALANQQTAAEREMNELLGPDMNVEFASNGDVHARLRTDKVSNYFVVDRETGAGTVTVGHKFHVTEFEKINDGLHERMEPKLREKWRDDYTLPYKDMSSEQRQIVETICTKLEVMPTSPDTVASYSPGEALRKTLPSAENPPMLTS